MDLEICSDGTLNYYLNGKFIDFVSDKQIINPNSYPYIKLYDKGDKILMLKGK